MPYKFQGWTLYTRNVQDKEELVTIYFFSKRRPKIGLPADSPPDGYEAAIEKESGLPTLRESEELRKTQGNTAIRFPKLGLSKVRGKSCRTRAG